MRSLLLLLIIAAQAAIADHHQVPFGDQVNQSIFKYHRATPVIATAGVIREGGIAHLKSLGFKAILDVRTAPEGVEKERQAVTASGLVYGNIPIAADAPTPDQLDQFAAWVEERDNYPLLIHCASANRVGTLWAMYRLTRGVPLEEALLEARTIGIKPAREPQVTGFAATLTLEAQ